MNEFGASRKMKEIKNFVVLGAGAMGAQIGALAAESGFNVKIRDIDEKYIQRGRQIIEGNFDKRVQRGRMTVEAKNNILSKVTFLTDLKEAVKDADYVIEAVPEILSLKQKVFGEASALSPADTVYATNTSSLSISEIAKGAKHPERVVGTHFFNPPGTLVLLEIVQGEKTNSETMAIADGVARKMNREIVHVKDGPGFLINRIWVNMAAEAEWAVEQGEAKSVVVVDSAARYKMGLPMGLCEIDDILQGGAIDTRYHVMEHFREVWGETYRPSPLTERAFKAGNYGKRTGKGFYDWSAGQTNEIPMNAGADFDTIRILASGINECAKLLDSGSTTKEEIDKGVLTGLNYPRGILRMADSTGIDKIVAELNRLENKYKEDRYKVSPLLTRMIEQGKLGRKTGEGFYSYGSGEYEFVKLDINTSTRVAKITLDRTYRANALNYDFLVEINKALNEVEYRKDVGCVVITGAGANFSGGADVSTFASQNLTTLNQFTEYGQDLFTRLETYPKPIVAAINGPAMGGGFEMVLACDYRVMSKKAQLRLPEMNLGIAPGFGGIQRLMRQVGVTRAKETVMLTEPIMADKALDWGVVNMIVDPDKLESAVDEVAKKFASGPPLTQKLAKSAFYYGAQADQRTGLFIEASISGELMFTKDANDGLTSMNYRRAPKFIGQ
jgi:enoyl-CoA hydratase/3-hydroxyacyl-CoA dehydrogenase